MSLTNPNKVVTEERLNEYHNTILPYLGGMPDILANKFSRADLYSTDEKMVGRWIDGKPLYQKVIDCGNLPNNDSKNINTGLSDITVVNYWGIAQNSTGCLTLPFLSSSSDGNVVLSVDLGSTVIIFIKTHKDRSIYTSKVVLQYTKTTDSSVEIGIDTDYSTTEKIVGTWIDGKPLYQKTVDFGALPNATTKNVAHGIVDIDTIISSVGFALNNAGTNHPIPYTGSTQYQIGIFTTKIDISIFTTWNTTSMNAYVTIQYTKTTD